MSKILTEDIIPALKQKVEDIAEREGQSAMQVATLAQQTATAAQQTANTANTTATNAQLALNKNVWYSETPSGYNVTITGTNISFLQTDTLPLGNYLLSCQVTYTPKAGGTFPCGITQILQASGTGASALWAQDTLRSDDISVTISSTGVHTLSGSGNGFKFYILADSANTVVVKSAKMTIIKIG